MPLHVQTDRVIKDSGLRKSHVYEQEKARAPDAHRKNLEELVTATRQFSYNDGSERRFTPLQVFLSR